MQKRLRIGTRESQLAVWQATQVKQLLQLQGVESELVFITSQGDVDLQTPLYEIGVQGIFTRNLDQALLSGLIDVAVHSMKDVPTTLARSLQQAAVLPRGNPKDMLVYKQGLPSGSEELGSYIVATSSLRRKAQWLNRYPGHRIENLRGNVNTRLRKLQENPWNGAIFAAAGLERLQLVPPKSMELDWMLPAPAQGAVLVICREQDSETYAVCQMLDDPHTRMCAQIERDFLRTLMGGCSTPIGALAEMESGELFFRANLLSADGSRKAEIEKILPADQALDLGRSCALELLRGPGKEIVDSFSS
jgi:hydroxymethylbilane synthase